MNEKLIELAERRTTLSARAATQRAELSQALTPLRGALEVVEHGLGALRFIRRHAVLLAGVVALVPLVGRWRTAKWGQRGLMVWGVVRAVKRILRGW
jgi:hypothetical protein